MPSPDPSFLLEQAAFSAIKPSPQAVVTALIEAEKTARRTRQRYGLSELIGNWQLGFISGTKKIRSQAAPVLGAGRYIPQWVEICLSYRLTDSEKSTTSSHSQRGWVENTVRCGGLEISLSGPIKFLESNNILAFDFTRLTLRLLGLKLYEGYIRGGKTSEANFETQSLSQQAFFAYFFVQKNLIAARGRGGGLAFWKRAVEGIDLD
jgi:hypothetical protein